MILFFILSQTEISLKFQEQVYQNSEITV